MISKWAYRSEEGVKLKRFLIVIITNIKGFLGKNETTTTKLIFILCTNINNNFYGCFIYFYKEERVLVDAQTKIHKYS